jgi:ADP-ribose pyrophosphatase YjhB (NUDIX family)
MKPETPLLSVDMIIEVTDGVVLIERKYPPPGWALPGGFVERGESLATAAVREAREETSLEVTLTEQFFAYSDPHRDPRGATASVVFIGHASGTPRAADDAQRVAVYPLDALPALAFDHGQILVDFIEYRRSGRRPPATR